MGVWNAFRSGRARETAPFPGATSLLLRVPPSLLKSPASGQVLMRRLAEIAISESWSPDTFGRVADILMEGRE